MTTKLEVIQQLDRITNELGVLVTDLNNSCRDSIVPVECVNLVRAARSVLFEVTAILDK